MRCFCFCIVPPAFFAAMFLVSPASSQPLDVDEARQVRLRANLVYLFPQLGEYQVTFGPIQPAAIEGLEEGSFVINGQQVQRFLTDALDSTFYLVAAGPFNVGLSEEELAERRAAREHEEAERARRTHDALLAAVAGMPAKGPADAPVTIVEFSDFQCPYCAAASDTLRQVMARYPEDVRLVYVQFPLESIHPWARSASIASLCAASQSEEAFWALHDDYFAQQRTIRPESVLEFSRSRLADRGVDLAVWDTCAGDETSDGYLRAAAEINRSMEIGGQFGISSTPGFFVNGYPVNGAKPGRVFEGLIERARQEAQE